MKKQFDWYYEKRDDSGLWVQIEGLGDLILEICGNNVSMLKRKNIV